MAEALRREPFDAALALRWLRQLKKNNDRNWFAAHRQPFDEHVKPGWEDLVAALLVSAVPLDERLAYVDPRRCVFRLARDIRFSNDKTPFKDGMSAWLSPLGKSGANAGYYVRVAPGACIVSAGIYTPAKETLEALRRQMAADSRPFDRILAAKKMQPYLPLSTDGLVRMPRGFPSDHPRAELIRARNYLVRRAYPDAQIVRDGAFATFRAAIRDLAPLVAYLDGVASTVRSDAGSVDSSFSMRERSDGWEAKSSSDHLGPSSSAKF